MAAGSRHNLPPPRNVLAVICCAAGGLGSAPCALAQTWIWTGHAGNWSQGSNWNVDGEVGTAPPNSTSNVFIDDGSPAVSIVTVDISMAQASTLTLDPGDVLQTNPGAALTVAGAVTLNGRTNLDSGTFTFNGSAVNNNFMFLGSALIDGTGSLTNSSNSGIGGTGTINLPAIVNAGLIAAAGASPLVISGTIDNTAGAIAADSLAGQIAFGSSGSLVFQNATVGGGTLGGTQLWNNATINGAAIEGTVTAENGSSVNGGALGASNVGFPATVLGVTFTDGSTLALTGTVTNPAMLVLGSDGGSGVTITGNGTLVTASGSGIFGTGKLAPNIVNGGFIAVGAVPADFGGGFGGLDAAVMGSGTLSLSGIVTNTSGTIQITNNAQLDLNGALVNGGQAVPGVFGTFGSQTLTGSALSAENGAVLRDVTINPVSSVFGPLPSGLVLTPGSILGVQGTVTIGADVTLVMGRGAPGATLNGENLILPGPGITVLVLPTLVNDGTIAGGGSLNIAIQNNGAIIAADDATALVLSGDVSNPNDLSTLQATSAGNLRLNSITAHAESVSIASGSELSGSGTIKIDGLSGLVDNAGIVSPGVFETQTPGLLTINGNYFQDGGALVLTLDGDGAGQYSQLDVVNGFAILEAGDFFIAELGPDFDAAPCLDVTGVCESFAILNGDISGVSSASQLSFGIGAIPGLSWEEVIANDQLLLELMGGGGSSGGGGTGGGSGGGTTSVPEPGSLALSVAALIALLAAGSVRIPVTRRRS